MSRPREVMERLVTALESRFGPIPQPGPQPGPVHDDSQSGGVRLFGSSVLDIRLRGTIAAPAAVHADPEIMEELAGYGSIEHRGTHGEEHRADLWRWSSARSDEQLLELVATFVRDGERYRLELSSNSIDFAKGLGYELPRGLRWDSLLDLVAEFIGAPPPATWS